MRRGAFCQTNGEPGTPRHCPASTIVRLPAGVVRSGTVRKPPSNRKACGFTLLCLDSGDEVDTRKATRGSWRDWLAEDNKVTPADEAAFRLDFEGWLAGLPERKRRVAELLAEGHDGVVVARTVGIAPSRVTQLRFELAASWRAFQGQAEGGPRRAAVATG